MLTPMCTTGPRAAALPLCVPNTTQHKSSRLSVETWFIVCAGVAITEDLGTSNETFVQDYIDQHSLHATCSSKSQQINALTAEFSGISNGAPGYVASFLLVHALYTTLFCCYAPTTLS